MPIAPFQQEDRGINHTDRFEIGRALYDSSLGPRDHRPKRPTP